MTEEEYDTKCVLGVKQGIFSIDLGALTFKKKDKQILQLDEGLMTITSYSSTDLTQPDGDDVVVGVKDNLLKIEDNSIGAKYNENLSKRGITYKKYEK